MTDPEGTATTAKEGAASEPPAWGRPLVIVDQAVTRFETRLCVVVLALEITALTLWISLKGMSSPADGGSPAGIVFRALFGALVLGLVSWFALRKQSIDVRRYATIGGVIFGLISARWWGNVGVEYTSNLLNWYQQASTLTLFGGLRGVGTRLTMMLALLGGALATASGKHITIDLVTRFLGAKSRTVLVVTGWLGAAVICASAGWGFFDHVAIEDFGAKAEARAGQKIGKVTSELGNHWFIFRKQIALDLKSTPHIVFKGEKYADWLTGEEWNRWVKESGIPERFADERADELIESKHEGSETALGQIASALGGTEADAAKLDGEKLRALLVAHLVKDYTETLTISPDERRAPIVVVPGKGEPRGELIHAANLVFPFGLFCIALHFLLRSLLVIAGRASTAGEAETEYAPDPVLAEAHGMTPDGDSAAAGDAPAPPDDESSASAQPSAEDEERDGERRS